MLQHEQTKRAERKAEHCKESDQIRTEESFGRSDPAGDAAEQAEHPDDERALFQPAYAFRRFVILRGHSFSPMDFAPPSAPEAAILARSDSGKSVALALRLNCNARIYA